MRSIWQGTLIVQKHEIAVKFYSAVEDRQTHFHLLHKRDRTRVQQRMVDADTEKPVPLDETGRPLKSSRASMSWSRPKKSREAPEAHTRSRGQPICADRRSIPSCLTARITWALARTPSRLLCTGPGTGEEKARRHRVMGHAQAFLCGALIFEQGYLMMITFGMPTK